ncbi:lactosylceramide 1,3-N-acetyl-beta-D-glucosaminyltransferase-like [Ornithodoros turicata]|uniref:lactosylceramide 1,3-N-acetyl-beta-D-glucosaminyltransferase-like n=1 Tax=Ornithodoros turicata TaxID=34597 RepID=UPI0031390C10
MSMARRKVRRGRRGPYTVLLHVLHPPAIKRAVIVTTALLFVYCLLLYQPFIFVTSVPYSVSATSTAPAVDYDTGTLLPQDLVVCFNCFPPPVNRSIVYRKPAGRDVEDDTAIYYNPKPLLGAPHICPFGKQDVIIAVVSNPSNHARRNAIRRTWGKIHLLNKNLTISTVFFLRTSGLAITDAAVRAESKKRNDIVQYDFTDKVHGGDSLQAAIIINWLRQCRNLTVALKVRDNTFVNIGLLSYALGVLLRQPADLFGRITKLGSRPYQLEDCAYLVRSSVLYFLNLATVEVLLKKDEGDYMMTLASVVRLQVMHFDVFGTCNATATDFHPCEMRSLLTVHPVGVGRMSVLHRDAMLGFRCGYE